LYDQDTSHSTVVFREFEDYFVVGYFLLTFVEIITWRYYPIVYKSFTPNIHVNVHVLILNSVFSIRYFDLRSIEEINDIQCNQCT